LSEPGTPVAARTTSELALRVASAIVMAALALATAYYDGWPFALFWTIAAMLVLREWLTMAGIAGWSRSAAWITGCASIAAAGGLAEITERFEPMAVPVLLAGAVVAAALGRGARGWAAAGVLYAGVIAVVPIDLRGHPAHGLVAILWAFAVVWLTDICAYFIGRAVGGPKLWPAVSPKKTWSGFIGGVTGGTVAALAVVWVARHQFGLGWYSGPALFAMTLAASVISQGGDLLESSMKRHFGAKDASHLIPGHGGVMDRLDSFWAVCVFLAFFLYGAG
jgi:phosphatidate cytidylyltransferase